MVDEKIPETEETQSAIDYADGSNSSQTEQARSEFDNWANLQDAEANSLGTDLFLADGLG